MVIERERGELPDFRRIVIETSGLADPSPILQTFATDRALGGVFHVEAVVTVVDAVTGVETLGWSAEARKQAILADRLIITKTDIAGEGASATLSARLRALNPSAEIYEAVNGNINPACLTEPCLRPAQYIRGGGRAQRRHWKLRFDRKCAAGLARFCEDHGCPDADAWAGPAARQGIPQREELQWPRLWCSSCSTWPTHPSNCRGGLTTTGRAASSSSRAIFQSSRCADCWKPCAIWSSRPTRDPGRKFPPARAPPSARQSRSANSVRLPTPSE